MTRKAWMATAGGGALAACALAGATVAFGAGAKPATTTTTTTTTATPSSATAPAGKPARSPETPLTGDVLAKVKAAAIAKVGGTVEAATTETDSSNAAAAYEAHVTKADGTHVTVILDSADNVLGVESGHGGRFDHHRGRPGGKGGGDGETPLTGDTATRAKAAAVAKEGGSVDLATTENDSSDAAAAYEVHVTKSDGSHAVVILDKSFAVLNVETHGPGGPDGHGPHQH